MIETTHKNKQTTALPLLKTESTFTFNLHINVRSLLQTQDYKLVKVAVLIVSLDGKVNAFTQFKVIFFYVVLAEILFGK